MPLDTISYDAYLFSFFSLGVRMRTHAAVIFEVDGGLSKTFG